MNIYASATPQGSTAWQQYTDKALYVDVNTSAGHFSSIPLYFTSIGGTSSEWLAQGDTAVYQPTATGFRVYVQYPDAITPAEANSLGWHINWVGILGS